jgi:hypothetical protein
VGEGVVVRPDQVSLGVLVSAVPRDAVDESVAVCGVREKRSDGKLPAHVITYLTLALCLFPDDDYTEVATKVTGSLDRWNCWDAAWTVPTASAITQDPVGESCDTLSICTALIFRGDMILAAVGLPPFPAAEWACHVASATPVAGGSRRHRQGCQGRVPQGQPGDPDP